MIGKLKLYQRILTFLRVIGKTIQMANTSTSTQKEEAVPKNEAPINLSFPLIFRTSLKIHTRCKINNHRKDKGIMEDYFFSFLQQRFGNKVKNNVELMSYSNVITPDFIYVDSEREIYI